MTTVLVTGVARFVGGLTAVALARHPGVDHVVGIDIVPPRHELPGVEVVRADIRGPVLGRLLAQHGVDTLVHSGVIATPTAVGGRASQKEINVIGTIALIAAVQAAPSVRRVVVKSTAAVYGASPGSPALFTESMRPNLARAGGFARDSAEVEGYVQGLARRRPDLEISVLRLASVIGPRVETGLTDYFKLPVLPVPLGFDGRLQLVHEQDAADALVHAAVAPAEQVVGVTNVAGDGVVTAQQAAGIVRRPVVPVPLAADGMLRTGLRLTGMANLPAGQVEQLAFGRVLDTTRMRDVLGFEPAYTTRGAFEDFAAGAGLTVPGVDLGLMALRRAQAAVRAVADIGGTP